MAVAKFRSRRLAIDITVTIVTGVAPPGSACLLLFSEGGEPAPDQARETTWSYSKMQSLPAPPSPEGGVKPFTPPLVAT